MTAEASVDPAESMRQHLSILRGYATRVLVQGESLGTSEEEDRATRMEELLAIGNSYQFTQKELVAFLFRGFFD